MATRSLEQAVHEGALILTDGWIETRIVYGTAYHLDPVLEVAGMVGNPVGRRLLRSVYAGYAAVARDFNLPLLLGAPTFRASPDRVRRAGQCRLQDTPRPAHASAGRTDGGAKLSTHPGLAGVGSGPADSRSRGPIRQLCGVFRSLTTGLES